jgi:iron complex transport system permease protein
VLSRRKFWITVGLAVLFLLVVLAAMPLVGSSSATLARALAGQSPDKEILFQARVPRVLLAALAGGALALAGVVFQALLRDALAEPYTLGVSSGAALGAVIAICFGWRSVGSFPAVWFTAFAGAALTILLVVSIASEGRRMSSFTLLLTGVTINAMCMAAILFLHYSAGFTQSFAIVRWLMGGIDALEYRTLAILAAGILVALAAAIRKSPALNLLAVGEEWAATRGVNLPALTFFSFLLGSFLTASVTALTGPIGFIGLIVPHLLRGAAKGDPQRLLVLSAVGGAVFLTAADTFVRVIHIGPELKLGVVTALLGAPFFLGLLARLRRELP